MMRINASGHLLDDDVTVFFSSSRYYFASFMLSLPRLLFVSVRGCLAQAAVAASIFLPIAVTKYIKQLSIGKMSVL